MTAAIEKGQRGLAVACGVLALWLSVQLCGLFLLDAPHALLLSPLATFLYTGLFVTAHDALHGSVAPGRPRTNRVVAAVALALYAAFDQRKLRAAHALHHAVPATAGDPDYSEGEGYARWLLRFVLHYFSLRQLLLLALVGNVLIHLLGVHPLNLIAVWVAPALLSAVQLFTFGTYLPHRTPPGGHGSVHRARSLQLSRPLSFLTCWHFGGRHLVHHEQPWLPWWRLAG